MEFRAFPSVWKTEDCLSSSLTSFRISARRIRSRATRPATFGRVTENVTLDRGRNQIRTGFAFQHIAYPEATPSQPRGNFTNNGIYTSVVNSTDPSTDRAQAMLKPQVSPYNAQQNYLGEAESVTASSFSAVYYPIRKNFAGYVRR